MIPLLGGAAAGVFLVSLLASGVSSSTVGTLAGQMIMQGFVGFRIPIWVRRLVTMVRRGTVFSHAAFRYVDGVIGAIVAAALVWFSIWPLQDYAHLQLHTSAVPASISLSTIAPPAFP